MVPTLDLGVKIRVSGFTSFKDMLRNPADCTPYNLSPQLREVENQMERNKEREVKTGIVSVFAGGYVM